MKEPNELPGKKTTEVEDPKRKKSPSAPVIETPTPPQVMDPSAPPPDTKRKEPTGSPGKGKEKPSRS